MKKIIYFIIPVLLVAIIVYGFIKIFILGDMGKGALQITTQPLSKVYLNESYIGTTPLSRHEPTNLLKSGEYNLKLVPIDGKTREFQDKITITKGVLTVVDHKFGIGAASEGSVISLEKLTDENATELLILTSPDNADIYLDGNYQAKSPFHKNAVTDSDHTLRIKKDGYKDKNIRIRTPKGFKLKAVIYLGILDDDTNSMVTPNASASATLTPLSLTPQVISKVTILNTPNGFLRVRSEPNLSATEISRVKTGDILDLLNEETGWYQIKLPTGTDGWISSDYARKNTN